MAPAPSLFTELGLLIGIAAGVSLLTRLLRQPLIIGYLVTGLIAGPFALNLITSTETLRLFSEIGVAILLFTVGLNLNPKVLKDYGNIALITGIGQVVFTAAAGFLICILLGFDIITSLYLSVALAFSSTIIILKLLSDKGDLEELYAKISIGFLLVQDLIAIILLFAIPLLSTGEGTVLDFARQFGLMTLIAAAALAVSFLLFPRMNTRLARSLEFLFLFSIAWGIGVAALFRAAGLSLESGALIAGIGLSVLPSRHEISARLTPLRDFFLILFFVLLGSQMAIQSFEAIFVPALVLSLLVLIGNPLILMAIMGAMGYRRTTSIQTGFTVAQISEFSLILVALGVGLGQLREEILSLVTLVGLITIFGSTYLILYSNALAKRLAPYLKMFERRHPAEPEAHPKEYRIFLFGGNRIGFDFIKHFSKGRRGFVVVDHDPEVVTGLLRDGVEVLYGDAGNLDLLRELRVGNAELVISTVPNLDTNLLILEEARKGSSAVPVVAVAHSIHNALTLYEAGATYVILPHFLGGKHAASLVKEFAHDLATMKRIRREHIAHLKTRAARGHEHPALVRHL
jgi:Kef-type K+ transport system membrane component KefB/Trk K+ transport system NAD-binding subunit